MVRRFGFVVGLVFATQGCASSTEEPAAPSSSSETPTSETVAANPEPSRLSLPAPVLDCTCRHDLGRCSDVFSPPYDASLCRFDPWCEELPPDQGKCKRLATGEVCCELAR